MSSISGVIVFLASAFVASNCQMGMVGGWGPANVADADVIKYANLAVSEMDRSSNSMYSSKLLQLKSAQVQVVSGFKYRFTYDVGILSCLKSDMDNVNKDDCDVTETQTCTVVLWVQSWLNRHEIVNSHCSELKAVTHESSAESAGERLLRSIPMHHGPWMGMMGMMRGMMGGMMGGRRHMMDTSDMVDMMKDADSAASKTKQYLTDGYKELKNQLPPKLQTDVSKAKSYENSVEKPKVKMDDIEAEFKSFQQKYLRKYSSKEEEYKRWRVFAANMRKARKLQETERGTATYGATQFADLTEKEFRTNYVTPKWDTSYDASLKQAEIPKGEIPPEFDWRDHGAVTGVKNQAECGSCWAFSTTGNIEGQWAVKKRKLVSLSEQELVDCDKLDEGCNGGLPSNAYKEIIRLGGLETEKQYPYKAEDEKCEFIRSDAKIYINGSLNISSNEADMAAWLYKNGPISIGINANAMQFYMGGVSHPWSFLCNPDELDHGVLIVGYGIHKGWFGKSPYWIVKNSWGKSWGEQGYYLVYRGAGVCGLNKMPTSALVL